MQPTLFDVGRAQLPPRVLAFASGVNEAREIRGFSLARIPIGFSAGHVREEAREELLRSELPIFADSGAFSEVAATPQGLTITHPISHEGWMKRLSLYQVLAQQHGSKLSVVVPDRVGDQEYTLDLLARYSLQIAGLAVKGARLLVPIQKGALEAEEFYRRACEVAGACMHPALPMKKAGMTHEQVLQFVKKVKPRHVHLLGMGYQRTAAKRLVRHLVTTFSELTVSLDSNRLRAVTGRARPMTQSETAMHAAEASSLRGAVDHPALSLSGEQLDYTEAIVFPSMWAERADLERVAAEGIQWPAGRLQFLQDPDTYLQQAVEGQPHWMCPLLSLALDNAWSRYVETSVHSAIRTVAIFTTFSNEQIAH